MTLVGACCEGRLNNGSGKLLGFSMRGVDVKGFPVKGTEATTLTATVHGSHQSHKQPRQVEET